MSPECIQLIATIIGALISGLSPIIVELIRTDEKKRNEPSHKISKELIRKKTGRRRLFPFVVLVVIGGIVGYWIGSGFDKTLDTTPVSHKKLTPTPFTQFIAYRDANNLCSIFIDDISNLNSIRGNIVKIIFDTSRGGFCSAVMPLNGYDASEKEYLTFWVKGEIGGEQFNVGIKNILTPSGQERKISQTISVDWQQIIIPLEQFGQDLYSLENISLGFTNELGSGTIYIDELVFSPP